MCPKVIPSALGHSNASFTPPTQYQLKSPCLIGIVRHTFTGRSLFSISSIITRTSSMFVGASGVLPSAKSHSDPALFFNLSLTWYRTPYPPSILVLDPTSRAQWYLQASTSLVIVCYHLVHSLQYQPKLGKFSAMAHSNRLSLLTYVSSFPGLLGAPPRAYNAR